VQQITVGIGLARQIRISNVWLLEDGAGRRFLIDTGHPVERPALRWHLWRAGVRRRGDLDAVMLTHRHSDHAGNAAWLKRTFDCPVLAHVRDAPYLDGEVQPPTMATAGKPAWARLLCHVEDRFPARVAIDDVFDDGEVRLGFRVFHTPGHTPGSVILHHEERGTLFSGDTILSGPPPVRFIERVALCFDEFSEDSHRAHSEARAFLRDLPEIGVLCSGHGPALSGDVAARLRQLIESDRLDARLHW
jgi:glyoxylase-like metal-dependent hydrolase (beta-lactamase superfamily II)